MAETQKSVMTVTGVKMFKGDVDGNFYDKTTLFCRIDLDDSRGTAKGFTVTEFPFGTSEEYAKLEKLPFPVRAEVEFQDVMSGKRFVRRVVGFKPLAQEKAV